MLRKSRISAAIAFALASLAAAPSVSAEEGQNVEKLQKIKVTGSRISRVDVEGATPVVSVSKAQIEQSGQQTVADYLKQASYNSFGGFSPSSGSSAQSQATVGLRGLGEDRTLVLLNGKRIAGSPSMGGTAINLNTIPMAAVERVEVNLDGGSALYGSDAIGGVINVILKEGFEGLTFQGRIGSPTEEGGDEQSGSIVSGISGEKGSLMMVYEHDVKDEIYYKDRDYLAKQGAESPSLYGRNIKGVDAATGKTVTRTLNGVDCESTGAGFVTKGTACRFDFAQVAAKTASRTRDTVYVNGRYHINDNVDFVPQMIGSRVTSFGRFAPAAGDFTVDGSTPESAAVLSANNFSTAKAATVYYRFNNVGPRDNEVTDLTGTLNLGFEGVVPTEAVGDLEWNAGYMYSKTDNQSIGNGYVLEPAVQTQVNSGNFVNGSFSADATKDLSYTTSRNSKMDFFQWYGGLGWEMGELPAGPVSWYLGAEYNDWVYSDTYDSQSEAGNVLGSSGNSGSGVRDVFATYIESLIPITEQIELNLAGRYDKYSDFGSAFSPKASLRYQPLDQLMFRTSWSQSFRAPGLNDLYAADAQSADFAKDYVSCQANGVANCAEEQYETTRQSNKNLKEETANTFTIGTAYNPLDNLNLSLDYYYIKIDDVIQLATTQTQFYQELNTGSNPNVIRDANGDVEKVYAGMVNLGQLKTSGIDFKADYKYDFNSFTLRYDFGSTYILKYEEGLFAGGPMVDKKGWNGKPDFRFNSGIGANFPQLWNLDTYLSTNYIDSQSQDYVDDKEEGHIASNTIWNLNVAVDTSWNAKIQTGVKNMFNRGPSLSNDGFTYEEDLYGIDGRVYYIDYTQKF
ncbi:TonB-dependent receptor [Aeromonas veronii]|uniref:TonB-dependent receptor n=1 Tax=Aeromonas veronii TaxID=654 RepID=A0ABY3MR81_AERVE|nr:TonB-dependent receptor [Aeromonas veronii]RDU87689.1 TonB-dependent receptor [Aeromonas veronii]RDU88885.1 TonB-dependent receptor [Aeromonas veronii]TEY56213.1 TonB-dependent receptor [Aeromonas veronii]TEY82538.1 TonB-dependent receptor [Aeromonas veronii]TYD47762.1 TonB-dependent receptor [Aeromonas veronii]